MIVFIDEGSREFEGKTFMNQNLKEIFDVYHNKAKQCLWPSEDSVMERPLVLARNKGLLLDLVDQLEKTDEFSQLVSATIEGVEQSGIEILGTKEFKTRKAIGNFWRRSGEYINLFRGKQSDGLWEKFLDEIGKRETHFTYLALLEGIEFEGNGNLKFGDFKIFKPSQEELDKIFQFDVLRVFYPWVLPPSKDLHFLDCYWWIKTTPIKKESWREKRKYFPYFIDDLKTPFQEDLELFLLPLVLYGWELESWPWMSFCIPLEIAVSDSLFESPIGRIHSSLQLNPVIDSNTGRVIENEYPVPSIVFINGQELENFRNKVSRFSQLLVNPLLNNDNWKSLALALKKLLKAFFEKEPLDQFIGHMVVIEALLQDKGEQSTKRLKDRIVRKDLLGLQWSGTRFDKVYDLRSNWIHGEIIESHNSEKIEKFLRDARELARRACLWFLDYLDACNKQSSEASSHLTRKELLQAIDMEKETLGKFKTLPEPGTYSPNLN